MKRKYKVALIVLFSLGLAVLATFFLEIGDVVVLNPKGEIAQKQSDLIITATWLMLLVVVPVFILTIFIAWKYRVNNKRAKYAPEWDYNLLAESIWWGLPCVIVVILAIMTWKSSHELDPFKPIESDAKPIVIQVIALQWKWLFIYPEQKIATVNFIQFPEHTPISFFITSDAPMNSFWIPQLGGQIYAMPGMSSKLHLIAAEKGDYRGLSANLSGRGFSGMRFIAKASSQEEFDQWVQSVKKTRKLLDEQEYDRLMEPSENNPVASYLLRTDDLYDQVVMKYMMPKKNDYPARQIGDKWR